MIQFNSTVLLVKDIEESKEFYSSVLGCEIIHDYGKNVGFKGGLAIWELREEHIISKKVNNLNGDATKIEVYFESENISEALAKVKTTGVSFLHELHEEPWGQFTFRFYDPDNHLIEIGETIPAFLTRMYNNGMSVKEISEKAYMDEKVVESLIKK